MVVWLLVAVQFIVATRLLVAARLLMGVVAAAAASVRLCGRVVPHVCATPRGRAAPLAAWLLAPVSLLAAVRLLAPVRLLAAVAAVRLLMAAAASARSKG